MANLIVFISMISFFAYLILILMFHTGLLRLPKFRLLQEKAKMRFSIIVAFRNEEDHIMNLLQSIDQINYQNDFFEVLLVNDNSTDQSVSFVEEFMKRHPQIKIKLMDNLRKSVSPKKDAISTAIKQSNFDWIITTDADCEVPKNWLQAFNDFIIQEKPVMIAAPVLYEEKQTFLHHFQQFDLASLLGVTMGSFSWGSPLMCSGANLAYKKEVFYSVNGFADNEHIASGDDVFLLHKIRKEFPGQVVYLNSIEALVKTKSLNTWKEVFHQRKRWAKKTGSVPDLNTKFVGFIVFISNLLLLLLLLFSVKSMMALFAFIILLLVKLSCDGMLVKKVLNMFGRRMKVKHWITSSLFYPFFSTSIVLLSFFVGYKWKGRSFKK